MLECVACGVPVEAPTTVLETDAAPIGALCVDCSACAASFVGYCIERGATPTLGAVMQAVTLARLLGANAASFVN